MFLDVAPAFGLGSWITLGLVVILFVVTLPMWFKPLLRKWKEGFNFEGVLKTLPSSYKKIFKFHFGKNDTLGCVMVSTAGIFALSKHNLRGRLKQGDDEGFLHVTKEKTEFVPDFVKGTERKAQRLREMVSQLGNIPVTALCVLPSHAVLSLDSSGKIQTLRQAKVTLKSLDEKRLSPGQVEEVYALLCRVDSKNSNEGKKVR